TGGYDLKSSWPPSNIPPPYSFSVVNGVWQLQRDDLKATDPNSWQIEQLYVNGRRATRARTPNRNAFSEAAPPKGWYQTAEWPDPPPSLPECEFEQDQNTLRWLSKKCIKLAQPAAYALLSALTIDQRHDVQITNFDYWTIDKAWIDDLRAPDVVLLAGKLP